MPSQTNTTATPTKDRLLSEETLCEEKLDDISGRTINRWISQLGFPQPIRLTGQTKRWRESEVDRWIAEREAASRQPRDNRPAGLRRRHSASQPSEAVTA